MSFNFNQNPNVLPEYMRSLIKLNELQKMTDELDEELADSQRIMKDIKNIFNSVPSGLTDEAPLNLVVERENISQVVIMSSPQILMEDMTANDEDVDLDVIIATMKGYAEELRKNLLFKQPEPVGPQRSMENLDLDGYASSLDQLVKRLANIKLNKQDEPDNKNAVLEAKLEQLCKDVNMFTQMVEAKKTLTVTNENWTSSQLEKNSLYYDNIINNLVTIINEVTYLLQNEADNATRKL